MSVARSSSAFPMRCRMTPTSSTFLRTARLSRRTGRRPAQGGDLETGHWPLRRGLTGKTVAVTDAPGHLVRFAPLPGRARGLAGMPDLLGGLEFGALIGDGALDADWLVGEVGRRGAGMCHGGDAIGAEPFGASGPRRGDVQMAASGREFPCENRRFPGDCDAVRQARQDRREPCGRKTVVNRPYPQHIHRSIGDCFSAAPRLSVRARGREACRRWPFSPSIALELANRKRRTDARRQSTGDVLPALPRTSTKQTIEPSLRRSEACNHLWRDLSHSNLQNRMIRAEVEKI